MFADVGGQDEHALQRLDILVLLGGGRRLPVAAARGVLYFTRLRVRVHRDAARPHHDYEAGSRHGLRRT